MRNVEIYVGTIKKCLDLENYNKYGDKSEKIGWEERTKTTVTTSCITTNYTKTINDQAILIKTNLDYFYQFKLTNTFKENLKIVFQDPLSAIPTKPDDDSSIFVDENTLIPYYQEQPKTLTLRRLKRDLLQDPRIKTGIEH